MTPRDLGEVQGATALADAPRTNPQPPLDRPRRPRAATNVAIVAVTVLFSFLAFRDVNLDEAWRALRSSDPAWLIPALVVFGLSIVARALRWRSLFARGRRPGRAVVLNATIIGYLFNSIMPARAGEAVRVVVLAQRSTAAPAEIVGTVVLERIYDVVTILVIFFAVEQWLPHVSWFGTAARVAFVLAVAIAAAVIALSVYGDRPVRFLLRPLRRLPRFSPARVERTVEEVAYGLSGLRDGMVALEAFLWSILAWMLSALCAYIVCLAFHLHLPFAAGVLVVVAVGLGMILPSAPAAIGVFEGATLIALKAYHVPHSEALPYALVLHAVNFFPFVLLGALLLHYNARHPVSSRSVSAEGPPAGS